MFAGIGAAETQGSKVRSGEEEGHTVTVPPGDGHPLRGQLESRLGSPEDGILQGLAARPHREVQRRSQTIQFVLPLSSPIIPNLSPKWSDEYD